MLALELALCALALDSKAHVRELCVFPVVLSVSVAPSGDVSDTAQIFAVVALELALVSEILALVSLVLALEADVLAEEAEDWALASEVLAAALDFSARFAYSLP